MEAPQFVSLGPVSSWYLGMYPYPSDFRWRVAATVVPWHRGITLTEVLNVRAWQKRTTIWDEALRQGTLEREVPCDCLVVLHDSQLRPWWCVAVLSPADPMLRSSGDCGMSGTGQPDSLLGA